MYKLVERNDLEMVVWRLGPSIPKKNTRRLISVASVRDLMPPSLGTGWGSVPLTNTLYIIGGGNGGMEIGSVPQILEG